MTPDQPTPACACGGKLDGAQVHTAAHCTVTRENVTGAGREVRSYTVMRIDYASPKLRKKPPKERTRDRLARMRQRRPVGR